MRTIYRILLLILVALVCLSCYKEEPPCRGIRYYFFYESVISVNVMGEKSFFGEYCSDVPVVEFYTVPSEAPGRVDIYVVDSLCRVSYVTAGVCELNDWYRAGQYFTNINQER